MAQQRHLRNAPIKEAIIDLRFQARRDLRVEELIEVGARLGRDYPNKQDIFRGHFTVDLAEDAKVKQERTAIGLAFKSDDGLYVAQCRLNGFTFSRLAPYEDWERFSVEAFRVWNLYVDVARPVHITRIATRYINRLELPHPEDLDEYLTRPADSPLELPVSNSLKKMTLHWVDKGVACNFMEAMESMSAEKVVMIIDVDVYKRNVSYQPGEPAMREAYEQLHTLKNEVFFDSITENTARIYE